MSKNHHGGPAPVPKGNLPNKGPMKGEASRQDGDAPLPQEMGKGAPDSEQDARGRQGDYTGKGEHPIQQPSALNDGA